MLLLVAPAVWALQRELKTKCHTYKKAPVEAMNARVRLVEVYSTSASMVQPFTSSTQGSRVRYMNRSNQLPSAFVLSGEVTCVNRSSKPVQMVKLTVVPLNAFHEQIKSSFSSSIDNQLPLTLKIGRAHV